MQIQQQQKFLMNREIWNKSLMNKEICLHYVIKYFNFPPNMSNFPFEG